MPEYLKLQGMGGLGVSESSIISANNNYRNNRNKINTDANYQKEDLLNKYKENISTLDGKSLSDLYEIREYYQKIADNEREQQKNLVDNFYRNEMLTNPEYYTEHGTKLTEDGKNKLKKYLDDNKEVLGGLYDTLIKELNAREVYTNAEKRTEKRAKLKYENQKNGFYSGGGMMSGGSYGR